MSYEIDVLLPMAVPITCTAPLFILFLTCIFFCLHLYISYAKGIVSKCPSSHRLAKERTIRATLEIKMKTTTPIHPCGEKGIPRILLASKARRIQTKATMKRAKRATAKRKPIHAVLMPNAKMGAAVRNGAGAARRQPTAANVASLIVGYHSRAIREE